MASKEKKYLIVGNGRLAHHLKHYFSSVGLLYKEWYRSSISHDSEKLSDLVRASDIVLLPISDIAIESFVVENKLLESNKTVVHFSGALDTNLAVGCHPLMTFTNNLYDKVFYSKILFCIDDDAPEFSEIFPDLLNPNIRISKQKKAKYHALCVMANNYTCLLWQKFFDELINVFGADSEDLKPFLFQTAENIAKDYKKCLTGPLSRNDKITLNKNLSSLEGDPYHQIYESFVGMYKER